jgi:signal transduction histidine kinase/DNA-binding response OmpR family regulator
MISTDKSSILIVDDLPEKLLVLESILADLDQTIITAQSGEEALRRVLEHDFAVILLDVNMPGIDGLETAAYIRRRKKSAHTPIIFITAFSDEIHTARGYSLGAVDYILSPIVPEILRTKVKVFVDLFLMTQRVKQQADERIALIEEQAARAAAEEATRRSAFLLEASRVLASSLNLEATLDGILRLVVPGLSTLSAIILVDSEGRASQAELAWSPAGQEVVRTRLKTQDVDARVEGSVVSLIRAENRDNEPSESTSAVRLWEMLRSCCVASAKMPECEAGSAAVLPLVGRGRTLGFLALAQVKGRMTPCADPSLIVSLAGRAAVALDNARLYQDIQDADRRKNEFLSMLAHELRNPLAPIRNAVHILRSCPRDNATFEWARDVIDRQANQLARLVDDLLDVSRITQGKIRLRAEAVDIGRVVARAVETSRPLIDARKHHLNVQTPSEPLWAMADEVRLAQVLGNLLNNAAKYTDEGGQIWLSVEAVNHDIVFRVRDNGVGISADMQSSIFELFTQSERSLDRSQGGLGIGLTLVRRIVEMHGGQVQVKSDGLNQGSEFIVRIPEHSKGQSLESSGINPVERIRNGQPLRILIVDDNKDSADSLQMLLTLGGHEVRVCHEGRAALELTAAFHPRIILLDIGLPTMNGYEVARRLRAQPDQTKTLLVALTGYGQEEDRRLAREAGFNHHLVKPIDFAALKGIFSSLKEPVGSM